MKHLLIIALATGLLFTGSAFAQEVDAPKEEDKLGWLGSGELGMVNTTGNSETFALNFGADILYRTEHWTHRFAASAINTSENGVTDAERYTAELQSNRFLTEKGYAFVVYRFDADKFGAYDPQQSLSTGYGRELMKSENHFLKGEIGIGYRKLDERESGLDSDSAIVRFLLDDSWQIWESTLWTNRLLVEAGSDNTFTQFDTGLAVSMTTRFAIKLGFQVRNNTDLPPGDSENTDTTTTVNLVYNF